MEVFRIIVEILSGVAVITALFAPLYKKVSKSIKDQSAQAESMKNALIALLHDRICDICETHIAKGFATTEERKQLEVLYTPYKAMGGNHTAEGLYEIVMDLPLLSGDANK